jgi:Fe-Mn family superoxide dismutase
MSWLIRSSARVLSLSHSHSRFFSTAPKFTLPELPYKYDALAPVISGQIMEIHHTKHHATYVKNLNAALEQYEEAENKQDISKMIQLQSAIKFNGGGHVNHSIFWTNLASTKDGGGQQKEAGEPLLKAIDTQFGSFDSFVSTFNQQTAAIQGSGWGWLVYNAQRKRIEILTMPNQDPISMTGHIPLLGIDVWEHAYYLDYKNARPDYLTQIWKVVNWKNVGDRYKAAVK